MWPRGRSAHRPRGPPFSRWVIVLHYKRCELWSGIVEMVEAVGIEPTSEERVLETSSCVALDLDSHRSRQGQRQPTWPASLAEVPGLAARHVAPIDPLHRRPRWTRRINASTGTWLLKQPEPSYRWQLCCSSFAKRRNDTQLPGRSVPRRNQNRPQIEKELVAFATGVNVLVPEKIPARHRSR